jgi:hypothetical protein
MVFLADGTIGLGSGDCEVFWDLREDSGHIMLEIFSDSDLTCRLKENGEGKWKGRWLNFEKMEIELSVSSPL